MKTAIYPGSFDPVTYGHIDLIERSSNMVDRLVVGVLQNSAKTPLFSLTERVNMLKEATQHISNVEVVAFEGMLIDFADSVGATIIVRGIRAVSDFEYELSWAQINHTVRPHLDTILLVCNAEHSFISSSSVRELTKFGGDISFFVPPFVAEKLEEKKRV